MSAQPHVVAAPRTRPVISGRPELTLIPTPAAHRGFLGTVIICMALFFGAFATVFALNTRMVGTAYEIRSVKQELAVAQSVESTLTDEVVGASTPQGLKQRAQALGLVPATDVQHMDLGSATILAPIPGE